MSVKRFAFVVVILCVVLAASGVSAQAQDDKPIVAETATKSP